MRSGNQILFITILLWTLAMHFCVARRESFQEENKELYNNCKYCRYLTKTFMKGMEITKGQHFGGGNTDWEERKLGTYKTSEARFIEVMDLICDKNSAKDFLDDTKSLKFKCHVLAEKHEEMLENWFFNLQSDELTLEKYLCVDELKFCCETGYFGKNCSPCPAIQKSTACFGRGKCMGSGTRSGNGTCICDQGYVGKLCNNCASDYFELAKNDTHIECKQCFDGCASGCTNDGPKECRACRTGYFMDSIKGCTDIDECVDNVCVKSNEECINTIGSYECVCADGYKRNLQTTDCEINVEVTDSSVNDSNSVNEDDELTNNLSNTEELDHDEL